jgi:predicted metal-dependent hydrolase
MPPKHIIQLDDIEIEVTRKSVKNLNIRIYPSAGRVAMSIPKRTSLSTAEDFARKKYSWIRKHLKKGAIQKSKKIKRLNYRDGEIHPVWGQKMILSVNEVNRPPKVQRKDDKLSLMVRPESSVEKRESVLIEWYRAELKREIPKLIQKWEGIMRVNVREFGVKRMKTRWGTCNIRAQRIWLSLELAKKDPKCLEYVVVHEMVHLHERLHNRRFYRLMDQFLPDWQERDLLLKGEKKTC